jgi:ribonuclease Z
MSGGLRLAILGSGSAVPDPVRGNPSQAVVVDGETLLFDCGERTTVNLVRAGINPLDVDALFFTHLHWDHISDFGYLAMTTWNCGRRELLPIYGPAGTSAMVEASIFGVHRADVEFVRGYLRALPDHVTDRPLPDPPFEAQDIDVGFRLERPAYSIRTGAVAHHQRVGMPSIAYRIESEHGSVVLTGDTGPSDDIVELARGADVLVHDTAFLEDTIAERRMWSHSGPATAGRAAQAAGVRMLVLTHLGPYTSPQPTIDMAAMYYGGRRDDGVWDAIVAEARSNYDGDVVLAYDALLIDVQPDGPKVVAAARCLSRS